MKVVFECNPLSRSKKKYPAIMHGGEWVRVRTKREALAAISQVYDKAASELCRQRNACVATIEAYYADGGTARDGGDAG